MNQIYVKKINSPSHNLRQHFTYNKILPKQISDKAIKPSDCLTGLSRNTHIQSQISCYIKLHEENIYLLCDKPDKN